MTDKPTSEKGFGKYDIAGAYHWKEASDNIFTMNAFVKARYEVALNSMEKRSFGKSSRVLDVGCGDGALSGQVFKRFGCEINGIDIEQKAIELAKEKFSEHGYNGSFSIVDGYDYPFEDSYFDVVFCADVIEHVADPIQMLCEMRRVLRPGGVLIVSTPIKVTEKPMSKEHVQEWFESEFSKLCSNVFKKKPEILVSHPLFWYEVYNKAYSNGGAWKLPFLIINTLAKFGRNAFAKKSKLWRFHMMQTLLLTKES